MDLLPDRASATVPSPLRRAATGPVRACAGLRPDGLDDLAARTLRGVVALSAEGLPLTFRPLDPGGLPPVPRVHPSGAPVDERYRVLVTAEEVVVESATAEGRHRALTTLATDLATGGGLAPGVVEDAPRLGWRGLTLDLARTPFPLADLMTVVDVLASLKLNVLHLHLTDDQGWRLPVASLPELARVGGRMSMSGAPGWCYSERDYRALVAHAAEHHVHVVPEIDVPGHVGALLASVPGVAAGRGTPGAYASRLHLDPDSPRTWAVLGEAVAAARALHPGPWLHIGGDEAFGMPPSVYERFFRRLVEELDLDPGRLVGWQEAVRSGLPLGAVQVWRDLERTGLSTDPRVRQELGLLAAADLIELTARGREDVARISRDGRDVVLSPALHAYLDRPCSEPDRGGRYLGAGLGIYLPTTIRQAFDFDLETVVPGLDPACVVGLEAALWTETVRDASTLQRLLLPRLAGLAQRGWEQHAAGWPEHAARLAVLQPWWTSRGWEHHDVALDPSAEVTP